jgi:hypothetical protein
VIAFKWRLIGTVFDAELTYNDDDEDDKTFFLHG